MPIGGEINCVPAKVQPALLGVMQERQIAVGQTTHALPEVQFDRVLMMVLANYTALMSRSPRRVSASWWSNTSPICRDRPEADSAVT